MPCDICYTNDIRHAFVCTNRCNICICHDCAGYYINLCIREQTACKCSNMSCQGILRYQDAVKSNLGNEYALATRLGVLKMYNNEARGVMEKNELVETLIQARKAFITSTFPAAIQRTCEVAFRSKLNKINIKRQESTYFRACMNLSCNGRLDETLSCSLCRSQFCTRCEIRITDGHTCDPVLVETMQLVREGQPCPKCHVQIFRSDGCNNMTCNVCGTKFLYNTGEMGGGGSHNAAVVTLTKTSIFDAHQDIVRKLNYQMRHNLADFESRKPRVPENTGIVNICAEIMKYGSSTDRDHRLAKMYSGYTEARHKYAKYVNLANELTSALIKGVLSSNMIIAAIHQL